MPVALADPDTWPLGRVLPLVRPDGSMFPPLGLLLAGEGPMVFETMISEATPERLRSCPRLRYATFAELERDGWTVDWGRVRGMDAPPSRHDPHHV